MPNTEKEIIFYYRNGCHLCEEMAAVLHAGWPLVFEDLIWIDVDESTKLQEKYGLLVPALVVDGVLICHFVIDQEKVAECIGRATNPV